MTCLQVILDEQCNLADNILCICLLQDHMQRLFLWSMSSFSLLISGYVLKLLGNYLQQNDSISLVIFKETILLVLPNRVCEYYRYSLLQSTVYIELYVHYSRSIRLAFNHYFLCSKFMVLFLALYRYTQRHFFFMFACKFIYVGHLSTCQIPSL